MAHYISPDGRVVYFEAEVKSDGTVRPRNYHEFAHDDTGGEDSHHSAEPAVGVSRIPTREKKKSKNQSYNRTTTPKLHSKLNKVDSHRLRQDLSDCLSSAVLPYDVKTQLSSMVSAIAPFKVTGKIEKKWKQRFSTREYYIILRTVDELNRIILKYRPSFAKEVSFSSSEGISNSDTPKANAQNWYEEDSDHKEDEPPELVTSPSAPVTATTPKAPKKKVEEKQIAPVEKQRMTDTQFAIEAERLISESSLSTRAKSFITGLTLKKEPIQITSALKKKIKILQLSSEEGRIKDLISKYNDLLGRVSFKKKKTKRSNFGNLGEQIRRLFGNKPLGTTSNSTAISTPKTKGNKGIDSSSKGNEWVSGNYVRKGPKPKYGYARDRFGRVQERDSYREDRSVNPYHSNSNYDREDDNDSLDMLD